MFQIILIFSHADRTERVSTSTSEPTKFAPRLAEKRFFVYLVLSVNRVDTEIHAVCGYTSFM